MKKFNLNNYVKVKLSLKGVNIFYNKYNHLPMIDENGFSEFQLWELMEIYGPNIFVSHAFNEIYIFMNEEDLEEVTDD